MASLKIGLTVLIISAAQEIGFAQAQLDESISRAESYLNAGEPRIHTLFIHNYLERKFGLKPKPGSDTTWNSIGTSNPFYPFLRLVDRRGKNAELEFNSQNNTGLDKLVLQALYCDKHALPRYYLDTLMVVSENMKYSVNQCLMAVEFLKELNCIKNKDQLLESEKELIEKIVTRIEKAEFMDDIIIESICFLYASGNGSRVKKQWITRIINSQASNGSYYRTSSNTRTNDKTTVLALWAMLEWKNRSSEHMNWIVE